MEKEAARRGQDSTRLLQTRPEEAEIVVVAVVESGGAETDRPVAVAAESRPIAFGIADGTKSGSGLVPVRIERRINVNERKSLVGKLTERLEVLTEDDLA